MRLKILATAHDIGTHPRYITTENGFRGRLMPWSGARSVGSGRVQTILCLALLAEWVFSIRSLSGMVMRVAFRSGKIYGATMVGKRSVRLVL